MPELKMKGLADMLMKHSMKAVMYCFGLNEQMTGSEMLMNIQFRNMHPHFIERLIKDFRVWP